MTADSALRRFPTRAQLAWVERTVGSGARVTGGRRMLGGIASSVHRLSLRLPDGTSRQVVLKRFTDPDWGDAQAIQNEATGLAAAEGSGVPAPRLLGASPDGADTEGVPSLLMTRAPGHVWLTPHDLDAWIRQLATVLPSLHAGAAGGSTQPASRPRCTHRAGVGAPTGRVDRSEELDRLGGALRRCGVRARRLPALQRALVARSPQRDRRLELVADRAS